LTFRTSGITRFGVCYHIFHPLRLVWWCCGEFPALRSRWNSTFNASTFIAFMTYDNNTPDWLNKLLFYILHKSANLSSTEICLVVRLRNKTFYSFFYFSFSTAFLCKCLILFNEEALWHSNEFSHLIWPNNLHDIPSILFVYFLALKLVRFQTSKQPINSLLNRSDLKMTVCEKIERLGSGNIIISTKANRSIGHVYTGTLN